MSSPCYRGSHAVGVAKSLVAWPSSIVHENSSHQCACHNVVSSQRYPGSPASQKKAALWHCYWLNMSRFIPHHTLTATCTNVSLYLPLVGMARCLTQDYRLKIWPKLCSSRDVWITRHMHSQQTWNSMNSIYDQSKLKGLFWHILQSAQQYLFTARRFYLLDLQYSPGETVSNLVTGYCPSTADYPGPRNKRKKIRTRRRISRKPKVIC